MYLAILLLLMLLSDSLVVHGLTRPDQEMSSAIVAVSGLPGVAFSAPYLEPRPSYGVGPSEIVHPGLQPPDHTGFVYVH